MDQETTRVTGSGCQQKSKEKHASERRSLREPGGGNKPMRKQKNKKKDIRN
jgi:hypothetical protein